MCFCVLSVSAFCGASAVAVPSRSSLVPVFVACRLGRCSGAAVLRRQFARAALWLALAGRAPCSHLRPPARPVPCRVLVAVAAFFAAGNFIAGFLLWGGRWGWRSRLQPPSSGRAQAFITDSNTQLIAIRRCRLAPSGRADAQIAFRNAQKRSNDGSSVIISLGGRGGRFAVACPPPSKPIYVSTKSGVLAATFLVLTSFQWSAHLLFQTASLSFLLAPTVT